MSFLVVGAFSDNPLVISIYCMALRSGMYSPGGYNMWLELLIMAVIIMCCIIAGTLYARRMDIISKSRSGRIRINYISYIKMVLEDCTGIRYRPTSSFSMYIYI